MKTVVGFVAFVLTLAIQMPQAAKVIRSRQTKDLSIGTYILLCGACLSWVIYGFINAQPAVWAANAIGFLVGVLILGYKLKFG